MNEKEQPLQANHFAARGCARHPDHGQEVGARPLHRHQHLPRRARTRHRRCATVLREAVAQPGSALGSRRAIDAKRRRGGPCDPVTKLA